MRIVDGAAIPTLQLGMESNLAPAMMDADRAAADRHPDPLADQPPGTE